MEIINRLEDLLFEYSTIEDLKKQLESFYEYKGKKPVVIIENGIVTVRIDSNALHKVEIDIQTAFDLCNKGDFSNALNLFKSVIEVCPFYTDAHRGIAQIHNANKEYDAAMDSCIEALKCDAKDLWSLILMGNILSRSFNDLEGAEKYYLRAMDIHKDNPIALNNIAGIRLEQGKYDEAIEISKKVLSIDDSYANSYYCIANAYYRINDYFTAFKYCVDGCKKTTDRPENPGLRKAIINLMFETANCAVEKTNYFNVYLGIKDTITDVSKRKIEFETNSNLDVYAKLEYFSNHGRTFDKIIYNNSKQYHEHFIVHELMHLDMQTNATSEGKNKVIITDDKHYANFKLRIAPFIKDLQKRIESNELHEILEKLYRSFVLRVMNCPLDLFVEQRIHDTYEVMRPIQFLSLFKMEEENIQGSLKHTSFFPQIIRSSSLIMNVVQSLHFKDLYGIDLVGQYKPSKKEYEIACDLFEEFKAYRDSYNHADEYELLEYFADSLNLQNIFEMVSEDAFIAQKESIKSFEEKQNLSSEEKERQDLFNETHKDGGPEESKSMMTMYMLGALQYFDGIPIDQVKTTAFEIAMLGMNGITPTKESGYKVPSIPNKDFGGYLLLAYYYVSWAIAIPEKVDYLGLPFKESYNNALALFNQMKK